MAVFKVITLGGKASHLVDVLFYAGSLLFGTVPMGLGNGGMCFAQRCGRRATILLSAVGAPDGMAGLVTDLSNGGAGIGGMCIAQRSGLTTWQNAL